MQLRFAGLAFLVSSAVFPGFASAPQPSNWIALLQDNFVSTANNWQTWGAPDPNSSWQRVNDGGQTVYLGQGQIYLGLVGQSWSDFRFASQIKLLQGMLNINYRTPASGCAGYQVTFGSGGLRLNRMAANCSIGASQFGTGTYSAGVWHQFEIVGIGGDIKVYVDGVLRVDYVDPSPVLSGGISFQSAMSGGIEVGDVEIDGPPPPLPQSWIKAGGPLGGTGYDIKMRPDNPDTVFVTDAFSGINISADGGQSWAAWNSGITARAGPSGDAIPVYSVAIDPNNPSVVWAGTQNVRGIFKSTDGGHTWTEKDKGVVEASSISFRGITVDPNNSGTVYAAAEIGSALWAGVDLSYQNFDKTKGVVYRTLDGGETWTAIWRGDNLARYVVIDPRNSTTIYVSTGIFDRWAANSDPANGVFGGVGIVKSTDGGATWTTLGTANGLMGLSVGSLFMHPQNPDILLAGAGSATTLATGGGVYLTTDGGQHWRQTLSDQHITSVEISAANPAIAYAGGFEAFYRSADGGLTWIRMNPGVSGYGPPGVRTGWPIDLQADPRDPNRLFLNAYGGGAFLTLDGGASWQVASDGYTGAQLRAVAVDPQDPSRIFAVGRSGPYRSDDLGAGWQGLGAGSTNCTEWAAVAVDPGNPDHVLISDDNNEGVILMSRDRGLSWTTVHVGPGGGSTNLASYVVRALTFAPSNPQTIYAGTSYDYASVYYSGNPIPSSGVLKSTDGGQTWQWANDSHSATENVIRIVVDPRSESVAYAATAHSGVLKTGDGGKSWQPMSQGLPPAEVLALAMDPDDSSVLYAGLYNRGLYRSVDGGATWQMSGAGLDPQTTIRDIAIDPANSQVVYAGSFSSGVFRSSDGGNLWVQINTGLRTRAVTGLAISLDSSELYAATEGEGVFRLDLKADSGGPLSALSAAGFVPGGPMAPASIVSLYGSGLAAALVQAGPGALPTTLGSTQVSVTDATGLGVWAPLYFVSPGQINLVVPAGAQAGMAQVRVYLENSLVAIGPVLVTAVAPGIFTATANGQGVAAALAARYSASGSQTPVPVFQCAAPGSCAPVAMDLGAAGDQLILMLYGTGIRGYHSPPQVTIGGVQATVLGAAAQSQYPGLDQVNVVVPASLKGSGVVSLLLTVDGESANTVSIRIQ